MFFCSQRSIAITMLRLARNLALENETKCLEPCSKVRYELEDMFHYDTTVNMRGLVDGGTLTDQNENTTILGIRVPLAEETT